MGFTYGLRTISKTLRFLEFPGLNNGFNFYLGRGLFLGVFFLEVSWTVNSI